MIENLIAVAAVLLTISYGVERFIEVFKPLFEKITSPTWQGSTKLLSAILIGIACAFLLQFNLFLKLGVSVADIVGYLFAGLIASTGSTTINRLLEWLKTLRNDTTTTVTSTVAQDKNENSIVIVSEKSSQSAKAPADTIEITSGEPIKLAVG